MKIVAAMVAVILASVATLGANAQVTFDYSGTLNAGRLVDVRDINGSITIAPGARLAIHAVKTAQTGDPNAVRITTETTRAGLLVCVAYPGDDPDCRNRGGHDAARNDTRVDFTITLPAKVRVAAHTINGAIDVRSDGLVSATNVNGPVKIDADDVDRATTVNGSVVVRIASTNSRTPLAISSVSGGLTCTLPSAADVRITAHTLNGSIDGAGLTVTRSQFGVGSSAAAAFGDARRNVDLNTLNGRIHVIRA